MPAEQLRGERVVPGGLLGLSSRAVTRGHRFLSSGDIVIKNVALSANLGPGDVLAVPATGAYGRSMASNYNMLTKPGVLAVRDGKARWIIRPETVEDLLALDADA